MTAEIESLLVLQDRDQKLAALRAEQRAAPVERKALADKLAASAARLEAVRKRGRENEVERRRLEGEVQAKQTAIGRFKTQQQQTRKNEEFTALTKEISHAEEGIHALEDRELDLMEAAETLARELAAAEEEHRRAEALTTKQLADLTSRSAAAEARLAELESGRAALAAGIPAVTLALYERLLAKKGNAVVPLEHEVCAGCHMKATAHIVAQSRIGQGTVQCPNCGRILYREI